MKQCNPKTALLALITITITSGYAACGGGSSARMDDINPDQCYSGQIVVNGEAPIYTSMDTSRDKAKTSACRIAVEKCIGQQVAAASGVADGESIGNEIFSKSQGICRNDKILDEKTYMLDTIKMLRMTVQFNVNIAQLSDQIDTMKQLAGNPRAMILIREEMNTPAKIVHGFTDPQSNATSKLKNFLIKKGYTIIDGSKITRFISNESQLAQNPGQVSEQIKDLAAQAGADILILGSVSTYPQEIATTGPFKSVNVQGVVQVHALWGDGRVIGTYDERATGAQVNAIGAAKFGINKFVMGTYYPNDPDEELGGLAVWTHELLMNEWAIITRSNKIKMVVSGLDKRNMALFHDDLKQATAVKQIDERGYNGDTAEWEVTYPGRAFALADTLSFYGDNPKVFAAVRESGKKIKVETVKRGEVRVQFN
ncbi:MAG: hypothetical protein KDK39_11850 [Leptospiraceae bacterium]|nr:hypothetical protein [Leptospiraceae bacterium]